MIVCWKTAFSHTNVSMEICYNDIHICVHVLVKNVEEWKINFTFMLKISKDFLHLSDGPWKSHIFLK
jgi:hypothetical protein